MMDRRYWHKCAQEARILAETFSNPATKRIMLGIADHYDVLAESAERRRTGNERKSEKRPHRPLFLLLVHNATSRVSYRRRKEPRTHLKLVPRLANHSDGGNRES
jgi:hypothetical protein